MTLDYITCDLLSPLLDNCGKLEIPISQAQLSGLDTHRLHYRLLNRNVTAMTQNNAQFFTDKFIDINLN